ncbi:MAG: cytochrome c [Elusimicrobia bacterium]|nr:cytochrome c [Elusimicrobiota bacterium]
MRALALAALLAVPAAAKEAPALVFLSDGKPVLRLTAAQMAGRSDARTIELEDPFYGRAKRYRAVPLRDLLTAAYGADWVEDGVGDYFFSSLDGYRAHARVARLTEDGAMLAFADAGAPGWETLPGRGAQTPGPFYLVWLGEDQTPKAGYPWPWQIVSIEPALVEDAFPAAVPRGAPADSPAGRGWAIFRDRCLSCHSMSGDGGTVGPDLNDPRGITRYRRPKILKAFIRQASSFRRTKMPDFTDLSPRDLDDLLAYFTWMTRQDGTK